MTTLLVFYVLHQKIWKFLPFRCALKRRRVKSGGLSVLTFFLVISVRLPLHLAHLSLPIARTFFNCFLSRPSVCPFLPSTLQKCYVRAVVST